MILLAIRGYIQLGKAANVKTRGKKNYSERLTFSTSTDEGRATKIPELT